MKYYGRQTCLQNLKNRKLQLLESFFMTIQNDADNEERIDDIYAQIKFIDLQIKNLRF